VNLLHELGALDPTVEDPRKRLTPLGRRLARLPVDPRLGRMVLEADALDCADEVITIAAALSIQDVRERPPRSARRPTRPTRASPTSTRTSRAC
jgi:ATP-dependent helicase HrpA